MIKYGCVSRVTGENLRYGFNVHKQRFHGYPTKQMVQRSALRRSGIGNFGHRATNTFGRGRIFGCVSYVRLRDSGGRGHPVLGTRFLPLRVAQTPAKAAGLYMAKSKYDVYQSSESYHMIHY